jgi:hypothetical protein
MNGERSSNNQCKIVIEQLAISNKERNAPISVSNKNAGSAAAPIDLVGF